MPQHLYVETWEQLDEMAEQFVATAGKWEVLIVLFVKGQETELRGVYPSGLAPLVSPWTTGEPVSELQSDAAPLFAEGYKVFGMQWSGPWDKAAGGAHFARLIAEPFRSHHPAPEKFFEDVMEADLARAEREKSAG
jgi:hypothetical protein